MDRERERETKDVPNYYPPPTPPLKERRRGGAEAKQARATPKGRPAILAPYTNIPGESRCEDPAPFGSVPEAHAPIRTGLPGFQNRNRSCFYGHSDEPKHFPDRGSFLAGFWF